MSDHVLTSFENGIARIQLNRPAKKNALTLAMYEAITAAMNRAEADPATRVIFFVGTHDCFTSGNDIADFMQSPPTDESSPVGQFLRALTQAQKPMVAAVNGLAIGVGTTMLLHCDLVYAGAGARFQMPFVNLGLCPEAGSSLLLPAMLGHQRAAELILLGEMFDAPRAYELGFVNAIFPEAELEASAMARAGRLAAQPPGAMRVSKQLLKQGVAAGVEQAMHAEFVEFVPRLRGPEAMEAMSAFMERRKPDFSTFR